ncbi:Retrovirus-related Pol polyprotein from transposon 17.6, partial [Mucuna pruriens]
MHPQDEAKTAFITDLGTYCYKGMPFRLKNAGATYQRLMDKIFEEIIGIEVEVYVDHMVVKSTVTVDHCRALERVFQVLRRHQLKLNPKKCSFEVQAGKFLGFMLIERGIEANPKKCQAIINMRSPRMVKGGTKTGQENHETIVPISNTLKKGDTFAWTIESEEAFLRLKALLACPNPDEADTQHSLDVVENVVSTMIVQDRQGKQHPVYFISKVLQDRPYKSPRIDRLYHGNGSNEWFLSVNGASNQLGSGVGVILEGPNGVLIKQSLHFEFKASNNQTKYEALLVGMKLAKELEAKILTVKSDSKLVMG